MKLYLILFLLSFINPVLSTENNKLFNELSQRVYNNEIENIKIAIDKKNINVKDQWNTNLLFSVRTREMAQILLEAGLDPNCQRIAGTNKETPLHIITKAFDVPPDVVQILLKNGAKVSVTDLSGKTALDHAKELAKKHPSITNYREKLLLLEAAYKNE